MKPQFLLCLVVSIILSSCTAGYHPHQLTFAITNQCTTAHGYTPANPPTSNRNSFPPAVTPTLPPTLDELVSFYRLRVELTTSSDWTTLELLNPENVLTVRQLNTVWAPDQVSG